VKLRGGGLIREDLRADLNELPDSIDFDVCRFDLSGILFLADQQLLTDRAVGDVVPGRFFRVGQVQVQRDPEGRRQEADGAEGQECLAYTPNHVIKLRCHAPQRLFVVGVNVGAVAFFLRTFFH